MNSLVTSFTGGQVFIAEVYFVKTTPVRSVPFGGPIGDMLDPLTGEQVQPRIFGEMSVVVIDPVRFVVGYSGQAAAGDNDTVLAWIKGLFMNGVKTTLGELCDSEGKSLLQAVSLTSKLAAAFVAHAPDLNDIGVRILQVGQFNINFSEQDRQRLVAANAEIAKAQREVRVRQIGVAGAAADAQAKQFQLDQQFGQDARYVKELAGSYQAYAAGQAVIGAGKGMAEHGVGGGIAGLGAQMAVGMSVGQRRWPSRVRAAARRPRSDLLSGRHAGRLRQVRREAAGREVLRGVRQPSRRRRRSSAAAAASSWPPVPSSAPAAARRRAARRLLRRAEPGGTLCSVVPYKVLLVVGPLALAALRGPSCGSDTPAGGPNAPCTRSTDCENELACLQGVCVPPDAGQPVRVVTPPADSGADGPGAD